MDYDKGFNKYILSALKEDIGSRDITTEAIISSSKKIIAIISAKDDFVVCGLHIAGQVFRLHDKNIRFNPYLTEGQRVKKGEALAEISGRAQSILTAERVALNFLGLLSAVATKTRNYVEAIKPSRVKIIDTRKTIPGLRELQKYAVRIGGGFNHRFCLDEMILVKDNHLKSCGGMEKLPLLNRRYKTEIEVSNLDEFKRALKLKPDIIMLDNMSIEDMKEAVGLKKGRFPKLEASGRITLENIKKVAGCGVDMISLGDLTHSIDSVDIGLEVE